MKWTFKKGNTSLDCSFNTPLKKGAKMCYQLMKQPGILVRIIIRAGVS